MESVDYNYFTSAPQSYHYRYGDMPSQVSGDGLTATSRMELLDSGAFPFDNFDYDFNAPLAPSSAVTPLPTGSASPPPQSLSILRNVSVDSGIALDLETEHEQRSGRRGSSEEKDNLTPAQSRRKAQNRAAQRAFRERKERHVRDLEAKLNLLTTTTSSLKSDNERLKLALQRAQTENDILRATASSSSPTSHHSPRFVNDPGLLQKAFPKPLLDSGRLSNGLLSTESSSPRRQASSPGSESHPLSASAAWDLLQSHPLYLCGAVDIGEVCKRLKKMAKREGMGPMFEEEEVKKMIEEVGRSGGDEMI